ncbi:hypothetical protein LEP1GSC044_1359 [Leptospira kirschneri serovar Grippotyphosa str. RM52]|nr:hypothetical protein LEP1GSC044_1359 [Leptospira kirschneri serovar Grippotyphosa str. RM52]
MKIKKIKTTIQTFKIIKAKPFWKRSNRAETPRFSKKSKKIGVTVGCQYS